MKDEILNAYGHVGLNLYTKFKNLHLTDMSTSEKFLIRLLEAYNDRLENVREELNLEKHRWYKYIRLC